MKYWIFALLLLLKFPVFSQGVISTSKILAGAYADRAVDLQLQQLQFQKNNIQNLAWLNGVELRTQTNRFERYRQEYVVRFSVNGAAEMARYRQLKRAREAETAAAADDRFDEALYERYAALADWYAVEQALQIKKQLLLVYDDQLQVLRQTAANTSGFRLEEMLKTEFDRDELALEIKEQEDILLQILQLLTAKNPGINISAIDTTGWITTEKMIAAVNLFSDTTVQTADMAERQAKIDRIDREYQLERAQEFQLLDFFQVQYGDRVDEPWQNKVDVSVGFIIPWSSSRKVQQSELLVEKFAAAQELILLQEQLAQQLKMAVTECLALYQQQELIRRQMTQFGEKYEPGPAAAADINGIKNLLEFNEIQIRRAEKIRDYDAKIRERYLMVLYYSGLLSAQPLHNYLRDDFEVINK